MKFGAVPAAEAEGAVLAHSLEVNGTRLRKGRVLSAEDLVQVQRAGVTELVVARLDAGDLDENTAAARLAAALVAEAPGLIAEAPFTGRVNLRAERPGVLQVDATAVARLNAVDPTITLATLPEWQRVSAGMMVATVKIIPYAVEGAAMEVACAAAADALQLRAPVFDRASLVVTALPGSKGEQKGVASIRKRLANLEVELEAVEIVPHDAPAIAEALRRLPGRLALILTASATSDAQDVGPEGLHQAGGTLTRFGMPVDPGNLLFLGDLEGRPVIGLPGCARSPALNGADWVMERVICGVPPTAEDIAAMGVGGLLKEIPTRPHPRETRGKGGARDLNAP